MQQTTKINGPAVRVIRELTGVRHGVFARRVGISPGYLTRIEDGSRQPSVDVIRRVVAGLNVPFEAVTYPAPRSDEAA